MVICIVFLEYPRDRVTFTLFHLAFAKEDMTDSDIRGVSMGFEMNPIPPEKARGWKISIDGVEIKVSHLSIESGRFGKLVYGLRPEGYDSWVFYEPGGGGSVTLPFSYSETGDLLVGLLSEARPNMGPGLHLCIIGGFKDPNETHEQARSREAEEEAGLGRLDLDAEELPGLPTNSNRAFFVTDTPRGEGVRVWGLHVPFTWLADAGEGNYRIDVAHLGDDRLGKAKHVVFMHWRKAAQKTADALARSAILQLLSMLLSQEISDI